MDCLANIIGVTQNESPIIIEGIDPADVEQMKISNSGLYLDDLPGGVHLKAVKYGDASKPLFDMAMGSIRNASKTLEHDLTTAVNLEYSQNRKNFAGQIGRMSFSQSLGVTGTWQGLRLRPLDYSEAVITLTRVTIILNVSATFNVYLYKVPFKGSTGQLLETWEFTTTAHAFAQVDVNPNADPKLAGIKLPLTENGEAVEYYIVYNRTEASAGVPKNNKINCSTCDKSSLSDYLKTEGVQFEDINALNQARADEYAHGLILDVSIRCDNAQLFCGQYNETDAVAVTMARAVWFKAGELLIEEILRSTDLSRYTTMDRERLWGKRNHFRAEYDGRITYLVSVIDISASNCYVCREKVNQPFVGGILS